jgi:hypothetical protein
MNPRSRKAIKTLEKEVQGFGKSQARTRAIFPSRFRRILFQIKKKSGY